MTCSDANAMQAAAANTPKLSKEQSRQLRQERDPTFASKQQRKRPGLGAEGHPGAKRTKHEQVTPPHMHHLAALSWIMHLPGPCGLCLMSTLNRQLHLCHAQQGPSGPATHQASEDQAWPEALVAAGCSQWPCASLWASTAGSTCSPASSAQPSHVPAAQRGSHQGWPWQGRDGPTSLQSTRLSSPQSATSRSDTCTAHSVSSHDVARPSSCHCCCCYSSSSCS